MMSRSGLTLQDLLAALVDAEKAGLLPNAARSIQKLNPIFRAKVKGVVSDSRQAGPGMVFVATGRGHDFVAEVRQAGALLVIGEKPESSVSGAGVGAYLRVKDSAEALGWLAARFYGNPSLKMRVIGVTGTSGKTTTSYMIESMLHAGQGPRAGGRARVGVIGTVNFRVGGHVLPSTHTTPGAVELQALLAKMHAKGAKAVVMEVSSHALKQKRVAGVAFDAVVFTNLTPEHLDYHDDMGDYFKSKALLFTDCVDASQAMGKRCARVLNVDDPYGKKLHEKLKARLRAGRDGRRLIAVRGPKNNLRFDANGVCFDWGGKSLRSRLIGRFNAMNLLLSAEAALACGVSREKIVRGAAALAFVPGRLERVSASGRATQGVRVFVDYAHKPDALEKVLDTVREISRAESQKTRLITVVGCGGDRDRQKRPVMGRIAAEKSDYVIFTSDNPRSEAPLEILKEIVAGAKAFEGRDRFEVEVDRRAAIERAIRMARASDYVLIAGKGHETYQIIGGERHPFDDREVARRALRSMRLSSVAAAK